MIVLNDNIIIFLAGFLVLAGFLYKIETRTRTGVHTLGPETRLYPGLGGPGLPSRSGPGFRAGLVRV